MMKQNGGAREGAGRPRGSVNKRSLDAIEEVAERYPDWSPLLHMATVANDETLDAEVRLDAAKSAAPFVHPKLKSVVADADELVVLEARIARARLEAQADALDERPGLADRLARALVNDARDTALLAATRPIVVNVEPSLTETKQNDEHDAAPLASRREPEKPDERTTQAPATSASADWVEKPASAKPYQPLLAWPEPKPTVDVDYDPTYGSYDLERK